jgi:hypothetical protein
MALGLPAFDRHFDYGRDGYPKRCGPTKLGYRGLRLRGRGKPRAYVLASR